MFGAVSNMRCHHFRLFWLSLFLCGCALFGFQVVGSMTYFLSWPVAVDVKINYNDTIVFPAITICNQNAFRYDCWSFR